MLPAEPQMHLGAQRSLSWLGALPQSWFCLESQLRGCLYELQTCLGGAGGGLRVMGHSQIRPSFRQSLSCSFGTHNQPQQVPDKATPYPVRFVHGKNAKMMQGVDPFPKRTPRKGFHCYFRHVSDERQPAVLCKTCSKMHQQSASVIKLLINQNSLKCTTTNC